MAQSLDRRAALRAVSTVDRKAWAAANMGQNPCGLCQKYNKISVLTCHYPSHWSGARLEKAFSDLVPQNGASLAQAIAEKASARLRNAFGIEVKAEVIEERKEMKTVAPIPANTGAGELAKALASYVESVAGKALDRDTVLAMIREEVGKVTVREVVVTTNGAEKINIGRAHRQFDDLLKKVTLGIPVWVAGPAGSGKTTAAHQVAKALGLPFFFNGAIDTEYKLSGFVDAQGRIVSTAFRRAYTQGGVYLFDEIDASLPGAVLAFNAALANGHADFPGLEEPAQRHEKFYCIAAGNTWGLGATTEYVGRLKMDAAFLDRFIKVKWEIDPDLELATAAHPDWVAKIQHLRAKARERGLKVVISPRASIFGATMLRAGFSENDALEATVKGNLSAQDWENLNK